MGVSAPPTPDRAGGRCRVQTNTTRLKESADMHLANRTAHLAFLVAVVLPPSYALAQSGAPDTHVPKAIIDAVVFRAGSPSLDSGSVVGLGAALSVFPFSGIGASLGANLAPAWFGSELKVTQVTGSAVLLLSAGRAVTPYLEAGVAFTRVTNSAYDWGTFQNVGPLVGLGVRVNLGPVLGLVAARSWKGRYTNVTDLRAGVGFPIGGGRRGGGWTR